MLSAGWNASTVAQHDEISPIDEDSGNGVYLVIYKLCILPPFIVTNSGSRKGITVIVGNNLGTLELHNNYVAHCSVVYLIGPLNFPCGDHFR